MLSYVWICPFIECMHALFNASFRCGWDEHQRVYLEVRGQTDMNLLGPGAGMGNTEITDTARGQALPATPGPTRSL